MATTTTAGQVPRKATIGRSVARPTLEEARRIEARRQRHAKGLAQYALRGAGSRLRDVADALGKQKSTVGHYVTDKVCPEFRDALTIVLNLEGYPRVSARAAVEAFNEALELSDIILEETPRLIERGLFLMREENHRDGLEDNAGMQSPEDHADALRAYRDMAGELAAVIDELLYRGTDLHELYRAKAAGQEGIRVGA